MRESAKVVLGTVINDRYDLARLLVACGWPRKKVARMVDLSHRQTRRLTTDAKVRLFRERTTTEAADEVEAPTPGEIEAMVLDYMADPNLTADERDAARSYLNPEIPTVGRWWILARVRPDTAPAATQKPIDLAARRATTENMRARIRAIRIQPV